MRLSYINVFVRDFERALAFYQDVLGLAVQHQDPSFGYAAFKMGPVGLAIAATDDNKLLGRHTGIGFAVEDLIASHRALAAKGVAFSMPPEKQPWGGFMAIFEDADGNSFYLDQVGEH